MNPKPRDILVDDKQGKLTPAQKKFARRNVKRPTNEYRVDPPNRLRTFVAVAATLGALGIAAAGCEFFMGDSPSGNSPTPTEQPTESSAGQQTATTQPQAGEQAQTTVHRPRGSIPGQQATKTQP